MRATCAGIIAAFCVAVALLAAVTSLAVVADFVVEKHESTLMWWEIVVISCASVSAFAAMVLMMFQGGRSDRGCAGPRSKLGVVASLAGAAAHVGMLAAYSAYLCRYWSLASWYGAAYIANNLSANAYSSAAAVPTTSLTTTAALTTSLATTHNAFDYFSDWAAKWQVMYVFGCAIGAAFWLLALIFACCDAGAAQRRQGAEERMAEAAQPFKGGALTATHSAPPPADKFVMVPV